MSQRCNPKNDMKTKGSIEDMTFIFRTKTKNSKLRCLYPPPNLHKLGISVFDACYKYNSCCKNITVILQERQITPT